MRIEPEKVQQLLKAERQRFIDSHPRSHELFQKAKRHLHDGAPMNWMTRWAGDFPDFRRVGVGGASG